MIKQESLSQAWIESISRKNNKIDKILVEKVIRALNLLEKLQLSGFNFIFKGGTSLLLLLNKPSRLSIDIDIIAYEQKADIDRFLDFVIHNSDFTKYVHQKRQASSVIEKAHYKFYYQPTIKTHSTEEYILLDILFESNPYSQVKSVAIRNKFIITENPLNEVKVPTIEDILGDKLTAFAPNTTGIPYYKGKKSMSMEIIKQVHDIGILFDEFVDLNRVNTSFYTVAKNELQYRNLSLSPQDVLNDIIQTALCISTKGQLGNCMFSNLQDGVNRIQGFIFAIKYRIEHVIISASKAAYLAFLLQAEKSNFKKFHSAAMLKELIIEDTAYNKLNKLKKVVPEAFFYWYSALKDLGKIE